jgi:hypothetical protein
MRLAEPYSRPASILIDEFDAGSLQSAPDG